MQSMGEVAPKATEGVATVAFLVNTPAVIPAKAGIQSHNHQRAAAGSPPSRG